VGWAADTLFLLSLASAVLFFALQLRRCVKAVKEDVKESRKEKGDER
jgi:hypothetical protein